MDAIEAGEEVGYCVLTHMAERDGDGFVAACFELGTVASGDSVEEAFSNLEELVAVQLAALESAGELERVFRENGVEVVRDVEDAPIISKVVGEGRVMRTSRHRVSFLRW